VKSEADAQGRAFVALGTAVQARKSSSVLYY
jgi:hypothetical protein